MHLFVLLDAADDIAVCCPSNMLRCWMSCSLVVTTAALATAQ
jgi:hypothetical protein